MALDVNQTLSTSRGVGFRTAPAAPEDPYRAAAGQDAAQLDRVSGDRFGGILCHVGAAGGTGQFELERLPVATGPFRNDVGDEPAVVLGSQHHLTPCGAGDVDTVHPCRTVG